jgi:pimeloyl-ACP methyl ester carboxylesterase
MAIGWVVAAAVLSGLVSAVVLDVLVFAGAREHVITGMALLAFAFGWGLLAVGSTRFTDQPQRWAIVPCAAMALTGAAVLVQAHSNRVMQSLGWVWPPLLLALTIWMVVQARSGLRSWTRRGFLYPVFAVLVIMAIGGAFETVQERSDRATYAMPGRLIDVGGHGLHIRCTGSGSPTVVLEPGLGEMSSAYGLIAPAVARESRVCVYDRAGRGWSESATGAQRSGQAATELHALLTRAGVPGPYVLAGHSFGGLYVLAFAARYPDQVAGLVLIDSTPPDAFDSLPTYPTFYSGFRRVSALGPSFARFGGMRLINLTSYGDFPEPARSEARANSATARTARSARDELAVARTLMRDAAALRSLGDRPLFVLTAGSGQEKGWSAAQDRLARLSSNSVHVTARGATHQSLLQDRSDAPTTSRSILAVVHSVRDSSPLTSPRGTP